MADVQDANSAIGYGPDWCRQEDQSRECQGEPPGHIEMRHSSARGRGTYLFDTRAIRVHEGRSTLGAIDEEGTGGHSSSTSLVTPMALYNLRRTMMVQSTNPAARLVPLIASHSMT